MVRAKKVSLASVGRAEKVGQERTRPDWRLPLKRSLTPLTARAGCPHELFPPMTCDLPIATLMASRFDWSTGSDGSRASSDSKMAFTIPRVILVL